MPFSHHTAHILTNRDAFCDNFFFCWTWSRHVPLFQYQEDLIWKRVQITCMCRHTIFQLFLPYIFLKFSMTSAWLVHALKGVPILGEMAHWSRGQEDQPHRIKRENGRVIGKKGAIWNVTDLMLQFSTITLSKFTICQRN